MTTTDHGPPTLRPAVTATHPIEVTFEHATGVEAGTLVMDHIPRTGDRVLWLTDVAEKGGVFEHDAEYPVTGVQWTLHENGDLAPLVRVYFGPTTDTDEDYAPPAP